jgi:hypothetical protein
MKVIPDKIQIIDTELLEFSTKSVSETDGSFKQIPNLEIGMHHALSPEDCIFKFVYEGKLELKNDENETLYESHFKCKFLIKVENLDEFKVEEGGTFKYDPIIGLTCTGITFSTLRGILFIKLLGTPLEHYMLPVIDPKSIFGS